MERQFWPSFWNLVDINNEPQEIPLHYHAVPHRILWTISKTRHRTFWWWMHLSSKYSFFFGKGKCRKHYFRISSVNALPVNCHPTVIAVDGRTSFKHDVNGPSSGPFLTHRGFFLNIARGVRRLQVLLQDPGPTRTLNWAHGELYRAVVVICGIWWGRSRWRWM